MKLVDTLVRVSLDGESQSANTRRNTAQCVSIVVWGGPLFTMSHTLATHIFSIAQVASYGTGTIPGALTESSSDWSASLSTQYIDKSIGGTTRTQWLGGHIFGSPYFSVRTVPSTSWIY